MEIAIEEPIVWFETLYGILLCSITTKFKSDLE